MTYLRCQIKRVSDNDDVNARLVFDQPYFLTQYTVGNYKLLVDLSNIEAEGLDGMPRSWRGIANSVSNSTSFSSGLYKWALFENPYLKGLKSAFIPLTYYSALSIEGAAPVSALCADVPSFILNAAGRVNVKIHYVSGGAQYLTADTQNLQELNLTTNGGNEGTLTVVKSTYENFFTAEGLEAPQTEEAWGEDQYKVLSKYYNKLAAVLQSGPNGYVLSRADDSDDSGFSWIDPHTLLGTYNEGGRITGETQTYNNRQLYVCDLNPYAVAKITSRLPFPSDGRIPSRYLLNETTASTQPTEMPVTTISGVNYGIIDCVDAFYLQFSVLGSLNSTQSHPQINNLKVGDYVRGIDEDPAEIVSGRDNRKWILYPVSNTIGDSVEQIYVKKNNTGSRTTISGYDINGWATGISTTNSHGANVLPVFTNNSTAMDGTRITVIESGAGLQLDKIKINDSNVFDGEGITAELVDAEEITATSGVIQDLQANAIKTVSIQTSNSALGVNVAGARAATFTSGGLLANNIGSETEPVNEIQAREVVATAFFGSLNGPAKKAYSLVTPVNIGNAPFDGSSAISLAQMGAQPASQLIRHITYSTIAPADGDGDVGDLWIVYTETSDSESDT